jgi:hypothetical protein
MAKDFSKTSFKAYGGGSGKDSKVRNVWGFSPLVPSNERKKY